MTRSEPEQRTVAGASSDLFISYSRADREFVVRLHDALAEQGRSAWVDWEGIPATAEWMAEIRSAVDQVDAIVFVISPESAASKVCAEELELGLAANKRVVPVLARDTAPASLPDSLARLNWIIATNVNIDSVATQIVAVLDTDLERLRAHARLLVRAREWLTKGEDPALLLRASELEAAEDLVGSDVEPHPTPEQSRLVVASRRATSRRQRRGVSAVGLALVIAVILATVALVQRNEAVHQREEAFEQTRVADSRALAARALLGMGKNLDQSVLLAMEAYRTSPTSEALQALHIGAQRSQWIDRGIQLGSPSVAVAYDPQGRYVATGGDDGSLKVWDPITGKATTSPIRVSPERVRDVSFDPTGDLVATAAGTGGVSVWNVATGQRVLGPLKAPGGDVDSVDISPDGRMLAAGTEDRVVVLWRLGSGKVVDRLKISGATKADRPGAWVVFSPDGRSLAALDSLNDLLLVDLRGLKQVVRVHVPLSTSLAPAFSPDGKLVAVGGVDRSPHHTGNIVLFDRRSGRQSERLGAQQSDVEDLRFSPDGRLIATAGADGTVRLWDTHTGDAMTVPLEGHSGEVRGLNFSPDGGSLASVGLDAKLNIWDIRRRIPNYVGAVNVVAFSPDGDRLAAIEPYALWVGTAARGDSAVVLRDTKDFGLVGHPQTGDKPYGAAFSPEGRLLFVSTLKGTLLRFDGDTGTMETALTHHPGYLFYSAMSPDGRTVAVGSKGRIELVDAVSGDVTTSLDDLKGDIYPLAFSPEGNLLAAGSIDGLVGGGIWDLSSAAPMSHLAPYIGGLWALAFSPDGRTLLAGGDRGAAVLDGVTGATKRDLGIDELVTSATFSPNGAVAALGTEGGEVMLFDTRTWARIGEPMAGQLDWVNSVAFNPEGSLLAAGSEDGSILLLDPLAWTDDQTAVHQRLCEIVGRSLTQSEWDELVGFGDYDRTCDVP